MPFGVPGTFGQIRPIGYRGTFDTRKPDGTGIRDDFGTESGINPRLWWWIVTAAKG